MGTDLNDQLASSHGRPLIGVPAVSNVMPLSVSVVDGVAGLEKFSPDIDALNAVSSRPNPFLSGKFLLAYAKRAEYGSARSVERLFLIREGNRLIGCFPMLIKPDAQKSGRKSIKNVFRSLVFLGYIDTDQPMIISAPHDQERCAKALIDYLCHRSSDWDLIHLTGQLPSGALRNAAYTVSQWKVRVRDIKVAPYNEIAIAWDDLRAYFRSLSQKMRSNISRQARKLYAAGDVELVHAQGSVAVSAWFDSYCDLDSRSWKDGTEGSIRRNWARTELYRDIAAGNGGFEPSFIGIVLDGVLVAGLILGSNQLAAPNRHGLWCLEMAYDRSLSRLGPGQLLFLLAMGQAIAQRHYHLNFMQNFDHYKHRWGATPITVTDVQIMRQFSARNVLAIFGDLRRRLQRKSALETEAMTLDDSQTDVIDTQKPVLPEQLSRARELTQRALATGGDQMKIVDREGARRALPFDIG